MTAVTRCLPAWAALLAVLALSLAGCADADADAAPDPDLVEVRLDDFTFGDLPPSLPAGTRIAVRNEADAELHELVAFALPQDEDRTVAELAALPPDDLLGALGEPATVLLAAPGADQVAAVGDGTLDEPGRYAVMCLIPTGVDPETYLEASAETEGGPPSIEGAGPPHIVHGMFAELTVE